MEKSIVNPELLYNKGCNPGKYYTFLGKYTKELKAES